MPVRVLTDSVADLPPDVARRLGIEVVPLLVRFGAEEYRDGLDLSAEQFYRLLASRPEFPTTSTPSPESYAEAYDRLAEQAEDLLVIALSSKLSGTYQAALQGRQMMRRRARVEVLDSGTAAILEGFVAMRAAEAAQAGASLEEAVEAARRTAARTDMLCTFDTLEYLRRGGRIGAAAAFLGSLLKVNPLLTLREGAVAPAGRTRSRAAALDRLFEFAASYQRIEEMALEHTACHEEAETLLGRLSGLHPRERIIVSKMTPVIGAHTGPGLLLVGVLGDKRGR
jgi:DegV family protein with EDD domain